jgi:hypothetical protein
MHINEGAMIVAETENFFVLPVEVIQRYYLMRNDPRVVIISKQYDALRKRQWL